MLENTLEIPKVSKVYLHNTSNKTKYVKNCKEILYSFLEKWHKEQITDNQKHCLHLIINMLTQKLAVNVVFINHAQWKPKIPIYWFQCCTLTQFWKTITCQNINSFPPTTLITFSIKCQHSVFISMGTIVTCKQTKILLLVLEKVMKNLGIIFVCFYKSLKQSQVVIPLVTYLMFQNK